VVKLIKLVILLRLKEISQKRLDIMKKIIMNKEICKLLVYDTPDCLNKDEIKNPSSLILDKVFPLPFVNKVESLEGTNLNVFFDNIRRDTKTGVQYKISYLSFIIACNNDVWMLDAGILRPDMIVCEIEEMINYKDGLGIGKAIFDYVRPISIANNINGYKLNYILSDFN